MAKILTRKPPLTSSAPVMEVTLDPNLAQATDAIGAPDSRRLDMMEPIQLMLSAEPPNSSWKATKKIPKLFSVPITRTFTKKQCRTTNHPQPPSGGSSYWTTFSFLVLIASFLNRFMASPG